MPLDKRLLAAAALAAVSWSGAALASTDPTGIWLDDTGKGAIEIKPCGSNGMCGHVVWVRDNKDADGCGKQIIGDVVEVQRGTWDGGWIYSPERKRRYDVELKPIDGQSLRVTGYAGSKLFSKSMVWKRAPPDLALCAGGRQAAATPEAAAPSSAPAPAPAPVTKPLAGAAPLEQSAPSAPAPVPAPAPQQSAEPAPAPKPERHADARSSERKSLDLSELQLDKYFTRLPNGDCRIDTPWARFTFPCEKR